MADQNKYTAPEGQPPSYPPAIHNDAPPNYQSQSGQVYQGASYPQGQAADGTFYGAPQDRGYAQQGPYQQQPYYGNQQQPYYGNQQQPYFAGQQQPHYGQQPMNYQQPVQAQGYFPDGGGRPGTQEGICAALLGLTACCCCMDFLL